MAMLQRQVSEWPTHPELRLHSAAHFFKRPRIRTQRLVLRPRVQTEVAFDAAVPSFVVTCIQVQRTLSGDYD